MNITRKIKDDYKQLTPKRQTAAKEILWTAFEMIPVVGKTGKIIRLSKDFFDKSDPQIELLIHIIATESVKYNLSETQLECFKTAITTTFGKDDFSLSDYFYNRKELVDLLFENYNTIKIEADISKNTRSFIESFLEKIFPMIHKFDTTDEMLSSLMNGSYLQHEKLMKYLQITFERAINHIINYENQYKHSENINDDNEEFEAKYNNPRRAQLFLDKTNIVENQILLKDVYVDPYIADGTSLLEFLNNWKKFYDEKGNETPSILVLSGKAGVGKTSLVSKLIADNYFDDVTYGVDFIFNDFITKHVNAKQYIEIIKNIKDGENCIYFSIEVDRNVINTPFIPSDVELINSDKADKIIIKFKVNEFRDRDDDENQYDHIIPFNLSYAISIHKAQGLEYDSVKIIITQNIEDRITKNIFYTAITRAKKFLKIYWSSDSQEKIFDSFSEKESKRDLGILNQKIKNS